MLMVLNDGICPYRLLRFSGSTGFSSLSPYNLITSLTHTLTPSFFLSHLHLPPFYLSLTTRSSSHDIAVRWRPRNHVMSKMHWLLAPHVRRQSPTSSSPLVSTIVVIPVPSLFSPSSSSSVVEIVGVNGPGLHLGESHCRLHVVVEVRHGGHGVHGSSHGRRRHRLRLLDVGLLESMVVCRDVREDKGPLHGSAHLLLLVGLLRESLVAVAATDWVTGVATSPSSLLLVLHVPSKHPLTGRDQGKPR